MHAYAAALGGENIRVNSVHPTGCATPMVVNKPFEEYFNAHPEFATQMANLLPVPMIEPLDISNAMVYLCSDAGRYVTGVTLPVDAGLTVRSSRERPSGCMTWWATMAEPSGPIRAL